MALVIESTASNSINQSASPLTITKPSGLAVGDLLVAQLSLGTLTASSSIATPAGWTSIGFSSVDTIGSVKTVRKVAEASDVAASNFSFTSTPANGTFGGTLYRITGYTLDLTEATDSASTLVDASTFSLTISATPDIDGSLILASWVGQTTGGSRTTSLYTTTPSITFTESYDVSGVQGGSTYHIAGARGVQDTAAEITAVGATFSADMTSVLAQITSVYPIRDASGTNTLVTADAESFVQTGLCDTIGSNVLAEATAVMLPQTGTADTPVVWNTKDKPVSTWTNPDK